MISHLDIYRSAQVLIRQHGEGAGLHAAQRVDALAEKGDLEGERTWKRILRAIKELQNQTPACPLN